MVDDLTVRLIASVMLILAVAALALHQWWIYAVLAVDFNLGTPPDPGPALARTVQDWFVLGSARLNDQPPRCPSGLPQESAPH